MKCSLQNKKTGERGNEFKVVNHGGQLSHLQFELVDPLWPLHADTPCYEVNFLINFLSIPIYLLIGIDNRYQSITTRIFAIDWSSIININRLIDIDWYRLILIVIDYRFHRLDMLGLHRHC